MFTMLLPLQPQSAPCFCRVPSTESASANYRETIKMECKPNPLIKLRILCNAQCGAKVASLAAFTAHFDANPDAASGVAFDATHDANFVAHRVAHFVAKSDASSSAAYAANQFPAIIRPNVRSPVVSCARIRGRFYVAGRRVNLLLASTGCAPDCTRRPAPGVLLLGFRARMNFSRQESCLSRML
jgi:hypothetical protein